MSDQERLTPDNAAPAADASNFLSSLVKSSKNVASHDREEVARKVIPDVMGSYISPDLFFKLCNKSGLIGPQEHPTGPDFVAIKGAPNAEPLD
jgi:hypothetical protein